MLANTITLIEHLNLQRSEHMIAHKVDNTLAAFITDNKHFNDFNN